MPERATAVFARPSVQGDLVLPILIPAAMKASEGMDFPALRQQILPSTKTASDKAEDFLLESQVSDLSKDEWQGLMAGIPADVKKEIGRLKSAGTQLHVHICVVYTRGSFREHNLHSFSLACMVCIHTLAPITYCLYLGNGCFPAFNSTAVTRIGLSGISSLLGCHRTYKPSQYSLSALFVA